MSQVEYDALRETIEAVGAEDVKGPAMPVDVYLQEAEDLYYWCRGDGEALVGAGLDAGVIESMPIRIGALRQAQSKWKATRFTKKEAAATWKEQAPVAFDLRDELLHHFRFAFRNDADLAKRVSAIAEGSSNTDMLQDLNDLNVLGKEHAGPLETIGFDMALLDKAAKTSDELASLWAVAHGDATGSDEIKRFRDKAYTYLKAAVDEIREYGRYVFWKDEERLAGYGSAYLRRFYKRKKETVVEEPVVGE